MALNNQLRPKHVSSKTNILYILVLLDPKLNRKHQNLAKRFHKENIGVDFETQFDSAVENFH